MGEGANNHLGAFYEFLTKASMSDNDDWYLFQLG